MQNYGYMRKKKNVAAFVLGMCIIMLMWLYSATFAVVGRINGEPIYSYQLRKYQKEEKYNDIRTVADEVLLEQAKENQNRERKEGESFEEYLERYKQTAGFIVYGVN